MKYFNDNKNKKYLFVIGISIIVLITFSLSYAFFGPLINPSPVKTPVDITGISPDTLHFLPGENLNLKPGSHNLNENTGDLYSTTNPQVVLKASDADVGVIAYYDVIFFIETNEYQYSTSEKSPELVLSVMDTKGTLITNIDGLNYVTVNGVSGFDVTEAEGYYEIKNNNEIESFNVDGHTEEWTFTITMVNLNTNQNINRDKTFVSEIIFLNPDTKERLRLNNTILENNGGIDYIKSKPEPDLTLLATTNESMFAQPDDYGTSYYFRGAVDNNWVYFAGFYWRIIRINGDGSVRMIYAGTVAPIEEEKVVATSNIAFSKIATISSTSAGVGGLGYMGSGDSFHGLTASSNAKIATDEWYLSNLNDYTKYYISDTLFCNDKTPYTSEYGDQLFTAVPSSSQFRLFTGAYVRTIKNYHTLNCTNRLDSFTVSDTETGNGALTYPIGHITVDEVIFAGTPVGQDITSNYLYSGFKYYTMNHAYYQYYKSGFSWRSDYKRYNVSSTLEFGGNGNMEIKPVISLKGNIFVYGDGTWNNPYHVIEYDFE